MILIEPLENKLLLWRYIYTRNMQEDLYIIPPLTKINVNIPGKYKIWTYFLMCIKIA